MAAVITWHIDRLERTLADDRVDVVHYHVEAEEDGLKVSHYGRLELDGQVAAPYSKLTEQMVIGWVHSSLGEAGKAGKESAVNALMQLKRYQTRGSGLPW